MATSDPQVLRHQAAVAKAEAAVQLAVRNLPPRDPYRPSFHFTAPAQWMNDPNGFAYHQGVYHLFYQHHPYSTEWGPMHWGHAVSADLVQWEHLPIALAPSEPYDIGGIYSGSAVSLGDTLYLFYTGIQEDGRQVQCIAASTDGITFHKHKHNPAVLPPDLTVMDFRDPKVWNHNGTWYMVVGSTSNGSGHVLLYRSSDIVQWEFVGKLAESDGTLGTMWECPDVFPCGPQDVLMLSPMEMEDRSHRNIFITGNLDYHQGTFASSRWQDVDSGCDFYAAQTTEDDEGRRILIAWMDHWHAKRPSQEYGWAGAMTLPREVKTAPDGTIRTTPLPALAALRVKHYTLGKIILNAGDPNPLAEFRGDAIEIRMTVKKAESSASTLGLIVRQSADGAQGTAIRYDLRENNLEIDRSKSGFSPGPNPTCQIKGDDDTLVLHLFIDRSSVEIFLNEGRQAMTLRIHPDEESLGVELFSSGGTLVIDQLDLWLLR